MFGLIPPEPRGHRGPRGPNDSYKSFGEQFKNYYENNNTNIGTFQTACQPIWPSNNNDRNKNHGNGITSITNSKCSQKDLTVYYNNISLSDIVVKIKNHDNDNDINININCHRLILNFIPYFTTLFESNLRENKINNITNKYEVTLDEISLQNLDIMLKYVYGFEFPRDLQLEEYICLFRDTHRFLYQEFSDIVWAQILLLRKEYSPDSFYYPHSMNKCLTISQRALILDTAAELIPRDQFEIFSEDLNPLLIKELSYETIMYLISNDDQSLVCIIVIYWIITHEDMETDQDQDQVQNRIQIQDQKNNLVKLCYPDRIPSLYFDKIITYINIPCLQKFIYELTLSCDVESRIGPTLDSYSYSAIGLGLELENQRGMKKRDRIDYRFFNRKTFLDFNELMTKIGKNEEPRQNFSIEQESLKNAEENVNGNGNGNENEKELRVFVVNGHTNTFRTEEHNFIISRNPDNGDIKVLGICRDPSIFKDKTNNNNNENISFSSLTQEDKEIARRIGLSV